MTVREWIDGARKFLVALAAALASLGVAIGDGTVDASEWITVALAFLGALGVYQVANRQPAPLPPPEVNDV